MASLIQKYLYPALSNVIETVWQYTGFALNMPIENAISDISIIDCKSCVSYCQYETMKLQQMEENEYLLY